MLLTSVAAVRAAAQRAGLASVVFSLALAGAALLYSLRTQRTPNANGTAPSNTPRVVSSGSAAARPRGLAGVRRITIGCDVRADGTGPSDGLGCGGPLFCASEGGGLAVRREAAPCLKRFARVCDLYIVARVWDDAGAAAVTKALREAGAFAGGLDERKVLFSETDGGRVSMVRQLEPHLHVDARADVIDGLRRFVKFVALVGTGVTATGGNSEGGSGGLAAEWPDLVSSENVLRFETLDKFFQ
jgi:hypothetical protein